MANPGRKASIEVDAATAEALVARAAALGMPLEAYLRQLVAQPAPADTEIVDAEAIDAWLDELSSGEAPGSLPADFSRSDIYSDHD